MNWVKIVGLLRNVRVQQTLRLAALCSCIALTQHSLSPGGDVPLHDPLGMFEHAVAFAFAALVTRLAFPNLRSRVHLLAFSAASACFEICQIWIQGRSAGVDDWATSSFGACVGILSGRLAMHYARRKIAL